MASNFKFQLIGAWLSLITHPVVLDAARRFVCRRKVHQSGVFDPAQVHRILVHRMDALGDTVLTLPLLQSLRDRWPEAHVTYAAAPLATSLLKHDPRVNTLLPVASNKTPSSRIADWSRTCKAADPAGYDLAILPRWDQDDYGCVAQSYLLGCRWVVGHRQAGRTSKLAPGAWTDALLTHGVTTNSDHEVERSFYLLEALGVRPADVVAPIQVSREVEAEIALWLGQNGVREEDQLIALGVGAGEPKRIWPKEHFAALANQLVSGSCKVVAIGGPMDRETGVWLAAQGCIDATALPSIEHSAALLQRAALFIGNDSGPMHLAAGQRVPVIEISSHPVDGDPSHPHSPDRFAPWGVPNVVLRAPAAGCIGDVTVSQVLQARAALLP